MAYKIKGDTTMNENNIIKDSLNNIKDGIDRMKKDLKVFKIYMYILVVLVIITMILLIVQSSYAFNLPKLKITYIKPIVKTPPTARIVGKTDGLPVLTVDFVNRLLWKVLQDVSNDTGYVFTTKGVNLAKKINLKGRYNFAVLLSKLFNGKGENTTVNLKTKRVKVIRRING